MTVRRKAGVKSVEGMAAFRCRRGRQMFLVENK